MGESRALFVSMTGVTNSITSGNMTSVLVTDFVLP
jgi:hypothetical protein